ncbi:putative Neurexin IV [Daphnia magna]|uniref:Putative Neurexin IV n=1 Tax=Daphnia magna TaxID=35525 RepID=A0A164Y3D2_9CRUS|nr:putative Neurexin IV [Daphnia magna]
MAPLFCRKFTHVCVLFLLTFWPTSSTSIALPLEEKLQQLTDSYIKFKEIIGSKVSQLEKKVAELEVINGQLQMKNVQLEEVITQMAPATIVQPIDKQNVESKEDLASKVPPLETLSFVVNQLLKFKEVVGEKVVQLEQKDAELEGKINQLESNKSFLVAQPEMKEGAERQEHAEKFIQVSHRRHQECIGSIQTAMEWEMTPFTFIVTWRQGRLPLPTTANHQLTWVIALNLDVTRGQSTTTRHASNKQMKALIELSAECHQSIVYECHYAPFEFNNVPFAWWNDRNGNPQYFWTRSFEKGIHACQCSIDGNCVDASVLCNCDATAPTPLADQGFITDKRILPITRLNFGRTQFEISSGVHTLGKFECSGRADVAQVPTSCEDLWHIGHTLNGFYSVMGPAMMETVFCNFTKLPGDDDFQKLVGYIDVKSVPTYFYVQRSERFSKVNTSIPFDVALVNIGNAMNLTTGIFTAPRAGTYFFSFTGLAEFPTFSSLLYLGIDLYLNDNLIGRGFVEDANTTAGQFSPVTLQSTLNLQPGDQVWLEIDSLMPPLVDERIVRRNKRMLPTKGVVLFDDSRHFTHFTGWMLEEDISQSL